MTAFDLAGRTAYVTGGAQGIGSAVVRALLESGARVAFSNVASDGLDTARSAVPDALAIEADLTVAADVDRANRQVADWAGGPLDILVNNAGRGGSNAFPDATDEDWQHSFELNLMSHVRTMRYFLGAMAEHGAIVNVCSDLAKQPEAVPVEYGAMKAALLHVTKNLALHHPPLRVNAVLPGPVWTPLWTDPGGLVDQLAERYGTDRVTAVDRYLRDRQLPLGIASPEQVASLVLFLVSPGAAAITGAAVELGGTIRGL